MSLQDDVLADRLAAYVRLRGGWPVPLAGTLYWLAVAGMGLFLPPAGQLNLAFIASGAIFPVAVALAAIFRNPFMKDRTATGSVLVPALLSMLLFWPMLVVAAQAGDAVVVLVILAIGMSIHWPVIGWSYGRTALFSAHAVVRALAVLALWALTPREALFLTIPLTVAGIYGLTVIALIVDSGMMKARAATA